jgi:hypothetical protein
MCSLDVRFTVVCVFNVIVSVENSKMTSKTHATMKRTPKLHIQIAIVIDPLALIFTFHFINVKLRGRAEGAVVKIWISKVTLVSIKNKEIASLDEKVEMAGCLARGHLYGGISKGKVNSAEDIGGPGGSYNWTLVQIDGIHKIVY